MAYNLSGFSDHAYENITRSLFTRLVGNPLPILEPFGSLNNERNRQEHRVIITAILSPKGNNKTLSEQDYARLKDRIAALLADEPIEVGIQINLNHFLEGAYICHDLRSFLWFERVSRILNENVKLSIISDNTSFWFYAMLPVNIPENLFTYWIPMCNGDIDTARWKIIEVDNNHVILEVDLLSACILYNRNYTLNYGAAPFDLALMIEYFVN